MSTQTNSGLQNILIIGGGKIGKVHLEIWQSLGYRVAVLDLKLATIQQLEKLYQVKTYAGLNEVTDFQVDVIDMAFLAH